MSMTKLEAVNLMLDAIGENPVSSLQSGLADAETAERIFNQTDKDVQSVGWHCNRERNYKLVRDTDNKFPLPNATLTVDTVRDSAHINAVPRGSFLYDVKNKSLTWTSLFSKRSLTSPTPYSVTSLLEQPVSFKRQCFLRLRSMGLPAVKNKKHTLISYKTRQSEKTPTSCTTINTATK